MNDWLEHGPQDPVQGDVLKKHTKFLQGKGFILQGWRSDRYGRFAALFKAPSGFPFILTSRGTEFWKNIFSMQKILLESWNGPQVLGYQPVGVSEPEWYLFDSELAFHKSVGESHYKEDIIMINIPVEILEPWHPDLDLIEQAWRKYCSKKERFMKACLSFYFGSAKI